MCFICFISCTLGIIVNLRKIIIKLYLLKRKKKKNVVKKSSTRFWKKEKIMFEDILKMMNLGSILKHYFFDQYEVAGQ